MAGVSNEESGVERSIEGQLKDALVEWRSSEQVENGTPSTSPPYWDSDDDDDGGQKPSELYGKYTWKIDKFPQISKRELRSNQFEVGGYKWYILIYPQGCDVTNHLSLFLCVANHDKLLPGWSHFAQFTIAVVNKDPKKSKYSDTLHRFWKKEHDWGWKKFMELSKVLDGFVDNDTLIIKAQVQVIRERADRPFRCLDCQYRRELVRVYLTNVEQICRRFVEERRSKLGKLIDDKPRWSSFCAFWMGIDQSSRRRMTREKTDSILKVLVKHFFIEKEVTSTLVMDALYSGLKVLEGQYKGKKSKDKYLEAEELPVPFIRKEKDGFVLVGELQSPIIRMDKDAFVLVDDVLPLLERAAMEPLPPKDEKGPQNRTKDGALGEEFNKDSIERDERRLTDLGRRTIEIFVLAHIFSKIEVAYQEAVALKRQEELIREEEAAWLAEIEQKARRGAADKEKKSKKKQAKQKRNNRKGKDKGRDAKPDSNAQGKIEQNIHTVEVKDFEPDEPELVLEKSDAVDDVSDVSDSIDRVPEILLQDSEDRDVGPVNWDTDNSEVHPPTEASSSEISGPSSVQNGTEGRSSPVVDDSSSTFSSDSVPFVAISDTRKGNSRYNKNQKSPSRAGNHQNKVTCDPSEWVNTEHSQPSEAVLNPWHSMDSSQTSKLVGSPSQVADRVVNGAEKHVRKEEASGDTPPHATSIPKSPSRNSPSSPPKLVESKDNVSSDLRYKQTDKSLRLANSAETATTLKPDTQKFPTLKPAEKQPSRHHSMNTTDSKPSMPVASRPLSAPLVPGPTPAVSVVPTVQASPILARSASAVGRLGPEPTASAIHSYAPQSYRNAIVGSSGANTSFPYSQAPVPLVSTPLFISHPSDRMDPNQSNPSFSFGMVNHHHDMLPSGPLWVETPQRIIDRSLLLNDVQSFDLYNSVHRRAQDHYPARMPGRQSHVLPDEFPHLDIINDLLDDEHGFGNLSISNSGYPSFGNGPHYLDPSGLGPATSTCRVERTRGYHDEGFQHGYGASGSSYDTHRDMMAQASPRYVNGQMDGLIRNQWSMDGSDLPYLSVRNADNDAYPYRVTEYQNPTVGVNGYTVFRPSNGL